MLLSPPPDLTIRIGRLEDPTAVGDQEAIVGEGAGRTASISGMLVSLLQLPQQQQLAVLL